jgi:CBS-domain-containing membrane protein
MRIQDIMSKPAVFCGQNETLNTAARLMWDHDCGVIPVVKEDGRIAGIVTDRDICMAAYTKGKTLEAIPLREVMSTKVFSCRVGDSLESAERVMSDNQVRRLPVVDVEDRPVGVVSLSDVVRYVSTMVHGRGLEEDVIQGFAAITQPRMAREVLATTAPAARAAPAPERAHVRKLHRPSI